MKFEKNQIPWNKGKQTKIKRCKKCGIFIGEKRKHKCRNVDIRGDRFCLKCEKKLKNIGWERYSKICGRCKRILMRQEERELKLKLIKQFGGVCEICGYSKYIECLEFHHKNKDDKKGKHFLEEILKHPEKFNLYCNRCHREIEIIEGGKDNGEYNKMGNG